MRKTWLALLAALALTLAACGAEEPTDDVADDPPAEDPQDEDEDEAEPEDEAPDEEPTLAVGSTDLGDAVVDGDGMTLYLFEPDAQGDPTCYDDCAQAWPPLLDDDPVAGDGVDAGLLGTTERDDGSLQVTYNGWPLYHWAGDDEPGDTAGQGVNDVWWIVDPAGDAVTAADDEEDGGGYGY